jgi:hypothetical protein
LANELQRGTYSRALVAFDGEVPSDSRYGKALSKFRTIGRPEIVEAIDVLSETTKPSIEAYVKSLSASQAKEAGHSPAIPVNEDNKIS